MYVTYERTLKTLKITFARRLRSLFIHTNFPGTHFVRTMLVPYRVIVAALMPIIGLECATHRSCSQLFINCLQHIVRF